MRASENEARTGNGKAFMSLVLFGLFLIMSGLIIMLIGWFNWSTGIGVAMVVIGLLCSVLGIWRIYHYRCGLVDRDQGHGDSNVYTIDPYAVRTLPPPSYTPYDNGAAVLGTDDERRRFPGPAYLPPPLYDGATNPTGTVNTPGPVPYHTANVPWTEAALHVPPPSYDEATSCPSTLIYQPEDPSALQGQPKDESSPVNQGTNES